jgi:hypothetical protein
MSEDYFSFMSEKGAGKHARQGNAPRDLAGTGSIPKSVQPSDVIDFEEEQSQIEVVESIISDTMIQRIFKRFAKDEAA